jgi:hypothetical protein
MNVVRKGLACVGSSDQTPDLRMEEYNIEWVLENYRNHLN